MAPLSAAAKAAAAAAAKAGAKAAEKRKADAEEPVASTPKVPKQVAAEQTHHIEEAAAHAGSTHVHVDNVHPAGGVGGNDSQPISTEIVVFRPPAADTEQMVYCGIGEHWVARADATLLAKSLKIFIWEQHLLIRVFGWLAAPHSATGASILNSANTFSLTQTILF